MARVGSELAISCGVLIGIRGSRSFANIKSSRRKLPAMLLLFVALLTVGSLHAAPRDEIKAAVTLDGSADASQVSRAIFLRGFSAVAVQVKPRDLPSYVGGAIELRPDLTRSIVARALKIASKQHPGLTCSVVSRIVAAAIAANPSAAVVITKAAIQAKPAIASCVIAAAAAAVPEQREEIAALESSYSLGLISAITRTSDDAIWHGNGTINPANLSDMDSDSGVVSPEQPSTH